MRLLRIIIGEIGKQEGKVSYKRIAKKLLKILKEASEHLDYCGYGDSWERDCAGSLSEKIASTIQQAEEKLNLTQKQGA